MKDDRRISSWGELALPATAGCATLGLFLLALRVAWRKHFTIDELDFAHAAWLLARGEVLYRDVFEIKFPLFFELLALPLHWLGDDPSILLWLRAEVALLWSLAAALLAWLAWRRVGAWGLAAPAFWLAMPMTVARWTEIRPDVLALALYVAAVGLACSGWRPARRGWAVGFVLMAAVWASYKVVVYGWIFAAVFVRDLVSGRRDQPPWLGSPLSFLGGSLLFWLLAFSRLVMQGNLEEWVHYSLGWSLLHQEEYPGFPWTEYAVPFARESLVVLVVAAIGMVWHGRRALASPSQSGDFVLLSGSLAGSLFVLWVQTVTYPYNLAPLSLFLAFFAGLGFYVLGRRLLSVERPAVERMVAAALLACALGQWLWGGWRSWEMAGDSNEYQLEVLERITVLTDPDDAIYDNTGGFVIRPHAYFLYKTDSMMRRELGERLIAEVPRAIVRSEAKAMLMDVRFNDLPAPLRRELLHHFQPFDEEIWLWGQRYAAAEGFRGTFLAIESGLYFVPEILEGGELRIDGLPAAREPFHLEKGRHRLSYEGEPATFHVLWLPRHGETYQPLRGRIEPAFSRGIERRRRDGGD